jgi:hypothetical protein
MKRSVAIQIGVVICVTALLSGSCTLFTSTPQTKYKIVDKASGRLRATYTLDQGARRPSQIDHYDSRQQLVRSYALEYDRSGRLSRTAVTTTTPAAPLKSETSYTYVDSYNTSGKLASTTQTSSDGASVTTYFGYDDAGMARGAVEQVGNSILAKDYPQ